MPKRIAITIAGAVSLGSYEAGVLYELLEAIRSHNEAPTTNASDKIFIDVITGASAGAMTAAMVAQRLMFDGPSLQHEFKNPLYEAWVDQINLMALAKMKWKERKWNSLFSSDLVESIGRKMLVESMRGPCRGPHPAVEQVNGEAQTLRIGLALTNLNGIDYMIPILGSDEGGFNYTSSLSQKTFTILPGSQDNQGLWSEICSAAVGSGAFPIAFRPKAIEHSVDEFGVPLPKNQNQWQQGQTYVDWKGRSSATFAHSDGGVLQNQPLGIAKDLVDATVADRELRLGPTAHCDSRDRLYVFVAPHSVKSTAEAFSADNVTIWAEIKHLLNVYTRQAMFHDWITAEGVNQKVNLLDTRAKELAEAIIRGKVDTASLIKAAADLNALLMPNQENERLTRLQEQYSAEFNTVLGSAGKPAADAFLGAIATLEAAAHLESQDKMRIVAVIADERKELAGSGLAAFVGFFKKSYRQHDYWVGRKKTRKYLERKDVMRILGVKEWPSGSTWKEPFDNPTRVKLPLSTWEVAGAAALPACIMLMLRPLLLVFLLLVVGLTSFGVWRLFHLFLP